MRKVFCDRCGDDVTDLHRHYSVKAEMTTPPHASVGLAKTSIDLCVTCARQFKNFMTERQPERAQAA